MPDFRIMPAQRTDLAPNSCTRWGFYISNHPKADEKVGVYVASWDTPEKARAAAICLGYSPEIVRDIAFLRSIAGKEWSV